MTVPSLHAATAVTASASAENAKSLAPAKALAPLTRRQWLAYGPFLAQMVVIRKCNLSCAYCSEFDKVSEPVDTATLKRQLDHLKALRTWAVCLTGGEPTLHPDLLEVLEHMRTLGFRRRMMNTNGYLLNEKLIRGLNDAGLTDLQVSVDGVQPNDVTIKVLEPLEPKLELLRAHARFDVVMSGVIGSAPPTEALEVVRYARDAGFSPRILFIHDDKGRLTLSPEELDAYAQFKKSIGRAAREAHDYRERLIESGEAPFKCRAGARYLYVDEFGDVHWCSQKRGVFRKPLLEYSLTDLKEQFHRRKNCDRTCTVGCARTASAYDQWRRQ